MFNFLSVIIFQFSFLISSGASIDSYKMNYDQKQISAKDSVAKYKKISIQCYREGDLEGFGYYSNKVLMITEKYNLEEDKIRILINLAIYHQRKDEYKKALAKYIEAQKLTSTLKDSSYLKIILNTNLGNFYYKINDYNNAKLIMKKVLRLADYQEAEKKKQIKVSAFNTLANITSDERNYEEAFNYYDELKVMLQSQDNNEQKLATLYSNIASCYRDIGNYEEAIKNGEEALRIIGKEKQIDTEASAKLNIGVSYYELKKFKKALLFLTSANKIANEEGSFEVQMKTHKHLAKVQESLNNIEEALKEQKKYTLAREEYLKTLTNTQRLKFENEASNTSLKISDQKERITFLNKEKIIYIAIGLVLLVLFFASVLNYYKKRKRYNNDTALLKVDNTFLESENELLRNKLTKIAFTLKEKNTTKKHKKSSISLEDQELYKERILNYMDEFKPYLNSEIKQLDVAKALDMSLHLFSEILNTCFEQNFNSFINLYRVEKAKSLMKDPEYDKYKIITVAYDSGFSSKPSFNRVFKKVVGCTPTEYQGKRG